MTKELRPCPVCGAAKGLYVIYDEHYMEWLVFCDSCKTSLWNEHNDTRDDAISTWNRRAERTCRVVRSGEPSPTGAPRERRCSECGGRLTRFGVYCHNCGARVVDE